MRRKGNKGTLLDAEGKKAIGDDALDPFLEGVDRDRFETLFGIDYDRLHEGGQEILAEGGEIGKLLFSAGGVAGLKQHEAALQDRLDKIYSSGRDKRLINTLINQLKDERDTLQKLQLSAEKWKSHERNLREAETRRETIESELRTLRRERERLGADRRCPAVDRRMARSSAGTGGTGRGAGAVRGFRHEQGQGVERPEGL